MVSHHVQRMLAKLGAHLPKRMLLAKSVQLFSWRGHAWIERKQKGWFRKKWFWRMYPRSGFWYRGTSAQKFLSGTKKAHKHKEFGQNPPFPDPPPKGTPDPVNSLCLGRLFPSQSRKEAYIKNFEGGGGSWGAPNSLCWISSRAFFHLRK